MSSAGSSWRKWDLHIHAPTTVMNNQFAGTTLEEKWHNYLLAVEGAGEIAVLGITDYCSVDGFLEMRRLKETGRLANVGALLPNIEFRILPVTGSSNPINLHVILSPDIADSIEDLLLSRLDMPYGGGKYQCTRAGLIALGRAFRRTPKLEEAVACREGVKQFKFDFSQLQTCLETEARLRTKVLVAVANSSNDGNSGLQQDGLEAIRTSIYRLADLILSGNPNDRKFWLGQAPGKSPSEVISAFGALKPCVHGSDAHDLAHICRPTLNRHTWIKAEPTFEGLRQVVYEPEHRVSIGEFPPPEPVHRLRSLAMRCPPNTVAVSDKGAYPYCVASVGPLEFASGLTCLVGGRGTGKSTLLNTLHELVDPGVNQYFIDHVLRSGNDPIQLQGHCDVAFVGDQRRIEVITQNEVEQIAQEPIRLTRAVFERLSGGDGAGGIGDLERQLAGLGTQLDAAVKAVGERTALRLEIGRLEERVTALTALIGSFADPRYTQMVDGIRGRRERLNRAAGTRERLRDLTSEVGLLLEAADAAAAEWEQGGPESQVLPEVDDYDTRLALFTSELRAALSKAQTGSPLSEPGPIELAIQGELQALDIQITQFLGERGLVAENLKDVASASSDLVNVKAELEGKRRGLEECESEVTRLSVVDTTLRERFEQALRASIDRVNEQFQGGHKEEQRIALAYRVDTDAAENALVEDLVSAMSLRSPNLKLRSDRVKGIIEKTGRPLTVSTADLRRDLPNDLTKTAQSLEAFLNAEGGGDTWELLRSRTSNVVSRHMRIDVTYDGRPIDVSSFGQRCSAVLIILLSLGNAPIIVDEPEAHLDSALIAGFLVGLIKRVKERRQIIFATHNANFVVNGDAELIHSLSVGDDGQTKVRSITIEDIGGRPLLLALEGGKEAFLQREGRYGLTA